MRIAECVPGGLFTALAYWDLVPVRHDARRLREIVLQAVDPNTPRVCAGFVFHNLREPCCTTASARCRTSRVGAKIWPRSTARFGTARPPSSPRPPCRGLGGVGKSTLAIQYAYQNRERYAGAWWLGADTQAGIVDGLVALGSIFIPGLEEAKDRAEAARAALKFISDGGFAKPWLLLYDNVGQPKELDGLLPRASAQVLITTRFPDWIGRAAAVPLGVFAPDEAVQFLLDRTERTDTDGAGRLADDLGWLPLALDHAAAYCKRTGTRFDIYCTFLPDLIKPPKDADYPRSVYATFGLAIEHAAADCVEAEKLMGILAYFAPDDIPLSLITVKVMSEIARGDAVAALKEASLLEVKNEGDQATISVHRLAQTVMRDRLAKQGQAEEASTQALTLVADAFPRGEIGPAPDDVRSWPVCAALRPHAIAVLTEAPDGGAPAKETSFLLNQLAFYLVARAEHGEAEPLDTARARNRRTSLGSEHPRVATGLNNLAQVLKDTNPLKDAEPLMRRALAIFEKNEPDKQPNYSIALNNLAAYLNATKGPEEAEPIYRRALQIDEQSLGPDHPKVAIRLGNLAQVLQPRTGSPRPSL